MSESPRQVIDPCYPCFALQVKARWEHTVATILRGKGYEVFLPLYKSRRVWSDRVKQIELPLLPGYVFCRFDALKRLPILTTPGVASVVGIGKCPVPIDEAEITAMQTAVRSGLAAQPWPFLQVGQRVRVQCGPLAGLEGVLLDFREHRRLVLSVVLLQRSIAVELNGDSVAPISEQHRACAVGSLAGASGVIR